AAEIIYSSIFFSQRSSYHRHLLSFPTRRSSDLEHHEQGRFHRRLEVVAELLRVLDEFHQAVHLRGLHGPTPGPLGKASDNLPGRSEEHTSELQSRGHLVCRLLLEKKKNDTAIMH